MAELRVPTLDFSPLGNLGQVYQKAQQEQMRRQTLANLGQGTEMDAQTLLRSGDMNLATLGVQMDRNRVMDGRDSRDFGFRQQEAQRAQQNADRSHSLQAQQVASRDPVQTATQRAAIARQHGIDPATPQGRSYILTGELPGGSNDFNAQVEQRKSQAIANGLDPSSPGFQSFVLTGKMPREDAQPLTATDKKAIQDSDEAVMTNQAGIDSLKRAIDLSGKAFAGPVAGTRGYVASFLGSDSDLGKGGIATESLTNEIMSNALGQLKAIFGGAPTEGERKILLDIQGSVSKPHEVRSEIYKRGIALAEKRMEFNRKRAEELRGGSYYKPQNSPSRAPMAQTQGITQEQYAALPSGTTFTAPDGTQRIKP